MHLCMHWLYQMSITHYQCSSSQEICITLWSNNLKCYYTSRTGQDVWSPGFRQSPWLHVRVRDNVYLGFSRLSLSTKFYWLVLMLSRSLAAVHVDEDEATRTHQQQQQRQQRLLLPQVSIPLCRRLLSIIKFLIKKSFFDGEIGLKEAVVVQLGPWQRVGSGRTPDHWTVHPEDSC